MSLGIKYGEGRKSQVRRIWDCTLFNGEWELLLLRVEELSTVVEKFIVVESTFTFSGFPKDLLFDKYKANFSKHSDKIQYVVIEENNHEWSSWKREEFQRNFVATCVDELSEGDLILLSDVDEIPFAATIRGIKSSQEEKLFGLEMKLKYFAFDYECTGGPEKDAIWSCVFTKELLNSLSPEQLRRDVRSRNLKSKVIKNAGEHLSYFMNENDLKNKILSFSHQELNNKETLARLDPSQVILHSEDLFERDDFSWSYVPQDYAFDFAKKNPQIYSQYTCIAIVATRILVQQREIETQQREIETQQREIETQRDLFLTSRSWRYTRAIRYLHGLLIKFKNLLRFNKKLCD